jgi:hypothetical protein
MKDEKRMQYLLKATLFEDCGQHGATEGEIEAESASITEDFGADGLETPPIPEDYAEFLKLTNGYAWNGVCFFGATEQPMGAHYTNPALYDRNDRYLHSKLGLKGCLVVGSFDDDIFVYSAARGLYFALDSLTLIPEDDDGFESFEDLFYFAVDDLYYECSDPKEQEAYRSALGLEG